MPREMPWRPEPAQDTQKESSDKGRRASETNLPGAGKRALTENSPTDALVVSQILADKVLLTRRGVTVELTFADKSDVRQGAGPSQSRTSKAGGRSGK